LKYELYDLNITTTNTLNRGEGNFLNICVSVRVKQGKNIINEGKTNLL
jgi:hypothetical protein